MSSRTRRRLGFALLLGAALLVGAELALRAALASDLALFAPLRRPERYASWFSDDDFWKLQQRFGGEYPPPESTHPELGWVAEVDHATLVHVEADRVGERRPVLLYGDSFAGGVPGAERFQEILNSDPEFAREHYLLNHGVGGYGTDQVLLLLRRTLDHYDDPFVVLSLMTLDLDRSVLSVRTGQKPRFRVENGELVLEPTQILEDSHRFFAENPPRIGSYLARLVVNHRRFPHRVAASVRGDARIVERKRAVNELIIRAQLEEVRRRGLDHVFLVFEPQEALREGPDWRAVFVRELLETEGVETMWARDVLPATGADPADYYIPDDGHPNTAFNRLVAEALAARILGADPED